MTNQRYTLDEVRTIRHAAAAKALSRGSASPEDEDDNNNISAHVAGRAFDPDRKWLPEDGERILKAYLANIADSMPAAVAHMIENAYLAGLNVDDIILAIEETAFAPNPSPRYLRAVLNSWIENGYTGSRMRYIARENESKIAWWKPNN